MPAKFVISRSGQIFARIGNDVDMQELGQLTLANFVNEAGLEPLGDNLFRETTASGPAIVGVPDDPGFAHIQQGYLEASNVDPDQGNNRSDLRAAGLRDEFEDHPGCR
jgi:flagellar basal-body rod protein FlgG